MPKVKIRKKIQSSFQQSGKDRNSDASDGDDADIFTDEINDFTVARNEVDLGSKQNNSDEEEELFGLVDDEDESDEELQEWSKRLKQVKVQARLDKNKTVPDTLEKSWGQKRSDFYGSGIRRKPKTTADDEEDEWIMEQQEIEKLQKKMDEDLDEDDFMLPSLFQKPVEAQDTDLKLKRNLSDKERIELQQHQHPEIEPLKAELSKCVAQVEAFKGAKGWRSESIETVYRMLGAHIAFYLHLLETGADTRGHPVLPRLLQWKKLAKLYEGFPSEWLEASEDEESDSNKDGNNDQSTVKPSDSSRLGFDADSDESGEEDAKENMETEELQNRPVTYEIEKNKVKKKSVPNNPRVKHREKFRKAKIRRKGKIRDFKPEIEKYRGEQSGIRSGIVRSMRLK